MNPLSSSRLLLLAAPAILVSTALAQAPMQIGNLVVLRVGDGAAALSSAATPAFLEEWDPTGSFTTPVQTVAVPTAPAGLQFACTNSGTANSEGQLNLSANGLYLTWGGYDAAPGTLAVPQTANPPTARVIGRFDILTGTIDTSTALTDAYGSLAAGANANIRGVVSDDGNRFWTTSPVFSTAGGGVRFVANLGDLTSTSIAAGNMRFVSIFHGDLYVTQSSGSVQGVAKVGLGGLPTGPAAVSLLNGFPTLTGPSNYDMFWADPDTLYVANDQNQVGSPAGIQKWVQSGGTWSLAYTLATPVLCRAVTGYAQNGVTTLWATGSSGSSTQILTVVDTGPTSIATPLITAPANTAYRGIRFLPKPSTLQRIPMACGPANLVATGNADLGTQVFTKVVDTQGFAQLIALDVVFTGFPLGFVFANCACTLGTSPSPVLLVSGNTFTLNILPSWATLGLPVFMQGIDLFTPPGGPCPDLLDLTLTDTFSFVVQ
ncbi:MAG: hypothetical protein KF830_00410 [Planctomycetes bacterium]|nr:hypothetical protein [Planctomycetota bacterium]